MKERIEKALKGIEYEIIEDANIVATIKINSDTFQFGRFETFQYHGLSLDNILRKPNGEFCMIVSKVIGSPEIHDFLILSGQIDFEQSEKNGYQTVQVLTTCEDRGGQFEIPNYNAHDYNVHGILETLLQQIVISRHQDMMEEIVQNFNPFTAKVQGLNPKSAQLYIKDIKRTSEINYHQLCHLFNEELVDQWIAEQKTRMDFMKQIEDLHQ
jgi:hypothetical protein